MRILRQSSENEMILNYLQCEVHSDRYEEEIAGILAEMKLDEKIITEGQLENEAENQVRKEILHRFRGYDESDMFENWPQVFEWNYAEFDNEDTRNFYYINYCYWNDISKDTGSPYEAAKTVADGVRIYDVPNDRLIATAKRLDESDFPPLFLITADYKKYLIIEGHIRMTGYAIADCKRPVRAIVGLVNKDELNNYDKRDMF